MHIVFQFLPFVVLVGALPLLIFSFLAYDRLVRIEFEQFPEAWTADGKPLPCFSRLPGVPFAYFSSFATNWCMLAWLFVTPWWARQHAVASQHIRRLRTFVALWNLAAMPLIALSAIIAIAFGG